MQRKRLKPRTPQFRILPYKMGSKGATLLAEGLRVAGEKCFRVFPNKAYIPRAAHTIINWGSGDAPNWDVEGARRILNHPYYVRGASNKLTAFQALEAAGVSIPEFTDNWATADDWMQQEGYKIVVRHKLHGHSGDGIELCSHNNGVQDLPNAPLYVKYIKKQDEYRVHVFNNTVIDIQMKRKKREVENEEIDYQVRNHASGWVYCRDNLNPPESIRSDAISAVVALGLDFGAVDIIYNKHQDKSYVLECNTAPGLSGTTLEKYVQAFKNVINN